MASTAAPTKQRAIPMPPRDPRLLELVQDYPLTTAWALFIMYVSLVLAVVEALS